jgi:hypothetical protein
MVDIMIMTMEEVVACSLGKEAALGNDDRRGSAYPVRFKSCRHMFHIVNITTCQLATPSPRSKLVQL